MRCRVAPASLRPVPGPVRPIPVPAPVPAAVPVPARDPATAPLHRDKMATLREIVRHAAGTNTATAGLACSVAAVPNSLYIARVVCN